MTLNTERLILRPWKDEDAESLYKYAKDPDVGPIAGWPVHTSVEDSLRVIRTILSSKENYAIVLKENNEVIGSIGLMIGDASSIAKDNTEAEIGYWLGKPHWGQGIMPEAAKEIIRYATEDLNIKTLWCAYFDGNIKSKRVQEKCGFKYHHTNENYFCELMNEYRICHYTKLV